MRDSRIKNLITNAGAKRRGIKDQEFIDREETYVELLGRRRIWDRAQGGNATRTVEQLIAFYNCRDQLCSVKNTFSQISLE